MAQFALVDLITEFLFENPKVDVIQNVTHQSVDLLEAGIDIALRGHAGALPDSSFVQSRVAQTPWFLFAAPDYLDRNGWPKGPEDLESHQGLKVGWKPDQGRWSLRGPDDQRIYHPLSAAPVQRRHVDAQARLRRRSRHRFASRLRLPGRFRGRPARQGVA